MYMRKILKNLNGYSLKAVEDEMVLYELLDLPFISFLIKYVHWCRFFSLLFYIFRRKKGFFYMLFYNSTWFIHVKTVRLCLSCATQYSQILRIIDYRFDVMNFDEFESKWYSRKEKNMVVKMPHREIKTYWDDYKNANVKKCTNIQNR